MALPLLNFENRASPRMLHAAFAMWLSGFERAFCSLSAIVHGAACVSVAAYCLRRPLEAAVLARVE